MNEYDLVLLLGLIHLGVIVSPPAPSVKPELKLAVTTTRAQHIRYVLCHSQLIRSTLIQNYWKRVTDVFRHLCDMFCCSLRHCQFELRFDAGGWWRYDDSQVDQTKYVDKI